MLVILAQGGNSVCSYLITSKYKQGHVEINIASNNAYRIRFDLGNWGGKRISKYNRK